MRIQPPLRILAAAIILLPCLAAAAPTDEILFARPFKLQAIEDDSWAGGVWLGTESGLYFHPYDGGMRQFSLRDGMPSVDVRHIDVTPERVYLATGIGVAVLEKDTMKIRTAMLAGQPFFPAIRTVHVEDGTVWLGSDRHGLYRMDAGTLAVTAVANPVNGAPFADPIYGLDSIGDELFISATGYGLVRWHRSTGQAEHYDSVYNQAKPYYGRILIDGNDVWIGSDGDGVLRLDRATGSLREYAGPSNVNALTVYEPLKVGGTIWFPTHVGVASYTKATQTWRSWAEVPKGQVSESANDLALVGGRLYAATAYGHLAWFDPGAQVWHEEPWWDWARGIGHNGVLTCAMAGSRLMFGTGGGGGQYLDPATGIWTRAGREPDDKDTLRGIAINAFAATDSKYLFGHGNGISEKDLATGAYRHYLVTDQQTLRGQNYVKDIEVDGEDAWVVTAASKVPRIRASAPHEWNPGLVARVDIATRAMDIYGRAHGFDDENFTAVGVDASRVWVGSAATGLYTMEKATGQVRHVWPPSGGAAVADILVADGSVWFASAENGLFRVDPQTLAVQGPLLEVAAYSLALDDGLLWVGTMFEGLHAYDVATGTTESYHTGGPGDYVGLCLVERDGILYMGTGWGVERFHLATRSFLPQIGTLDVAATAGGALHITSPAHGESLPGPNVVVEGTADQGQVQVRLADDPWTAAQGTNAWSATLDARGLQGPVVVSARLLDDAGKVLKTVQVTAQVGTSSAQQSAPSFIHDPLDVASVGRPLEFVVEGPDLPGMKAEVQLWRPGLNLPEVVPLTVGPDGLVGSAQPFTSPGDASYRIVLAWDDGTARLPAPHTGFAGRYIMLVQPAGSLGSGLLLGPGEVTVDHGHNVVRLTLQNTGSQPLMFDLGVAGDAADWASMPQQMLVPAGESRPVTVGVEIPAATRAGAYTLTVDLRLADVPQGTHAVRLVLDDDAPAKLHGGTKESPVPVLTLLAALVVAVAVRRGGR